VLVESFFFPNTKVQRFSIRKEMVPATSIKNLLIHPIISKKTKGYSVIVVFFCYLYD